MNKIAFLGIFVKNISLLKAFKIIRFDALASTNTFLKELCKEIVVDDFTVVITENQTQGRGQQEAIWQAEKGKNLTFSFYRSNIPINDLFLTNIAVTLGIRQTVFELTNIKTYIKWSNDVVVNHKKIAGILIENIYSSKKSHTIIGIGLNVNQLNFNNLHKATSIQELTLKEHNLETILQHLLTNIQDFLKQDAEELWQQYHQYLYKINQKTTWQLPDTLTFIATLKEVTKTGEIVLEKEDFSIGKFRTKEVQMIF